MNTTASPAITVDNLTRTYQAKSRKDAFTAVKDVSFEVYPGEVYGLLGTNGAGKTSLLEIVEGLAPPTNGTVTVLGGDPVDNDPETIRASWGRALARPNVRGLVVGRTLLYPAGDDVTAAVSASVDMIRSASAG